MRFFLEGEPEELAEKSDQLLGELIKSFSGIAPEFAERLAKALPEKLPPVELRLPVLKRLHEKTADEYARQMQLMVRDIGKVLDRSLNAPTLQKGENGFYDYTKPISDMQDVAFQRVKSALKKKGHTDTDFEEGGVLYGLSANDLIRVLREEHIDEPSDFQKTGE